MCGINGFISLEKPFESQPWGMMAGQLNAMNDTILHRGPDSEGIYCTYPIGFGFRRLSILDLSNMANQPMQSSDGNVVLIFNGEIYNYVELKQELVAKGYSFSTHSDTEVILNSYLAYGDECVNKFNGMWAFAIYDFRQGRLFCSRDRLGVKPFYYARKNDLLYFSSELKSLHKVCSLRKANLGKVYEYLSYGYRTNDGETFLENCFELLPGTNLVVQNGYVTFHKYWTLESNQYKLQEQESWKEAFLKLFEDAVRIRYRSDVPVALLLSGGLDSSAIAKVTDNLIERGVLEYTDIHAFIASFPNFKDDETSIAREFIKTCKHIKLHELVIDPESIAEEFDQLIYGLDHPVFSFTSVAHNLIMKDCQKRGIKVVLNGQGSDEAFAGYDRYIAGVHLIDQLLTNPANFIREFRHLNQQNGYSAPFLISQMGKAILGQTRSSYLRAKYQEKLVPLLENEFVTKNHGHFRSEYKFSIRGENFNKYLLNQIKHQGLNTILHYEDVSSMMNSIEIRSPFMDYRLMELAFSLPLELKFSKGVTKVIQRETIGQLLPDSITKNRKKIGFRTPFEDYLSTSEKFKKYVFDVLNTESFRKKKIWKAEEIINVFKNPKQNPQFPYWRILNLEVWSKMYGISNL